MARKKKWNSDDIISVLGHRYVEARVGRYLFVPRTKKFTYLHKFISWNWVSSKEY